jgi:hypothetical protein
MPNVTFMSQRAPKDIANVKTPTVRRPTTCTPSWWKPPP